MEYCDSASAQRNGVTTVRKYPMISSGESLCSFRIHQRTGNVHDFTFTGMIRLATDTHLSVWLRCYGIVGFRPLVYLF